VGCADRILQLYGVYRFFAEVDTCRDYLRDGDSLVHEILDWLSKEGFEEFFSRFGNDFTFTSAQEYRNRLLLKLLKAMTRDR
jgi:hypothetical protein